ncbi:MAG: RtcB family protein, partial [Candidatus Spechtbacteria bacterium]|nr:RtcB family protein [Candidatus Spechtbacteria bacterium]
AAIDVKEGVISPGLIGYDMNCGMRLLTSELTADFIQSKLDAVATEIQKEVPSGLGKGRQLKFNIATMDRILEGGTEFIIGRGYGDAEDLANCEERGKMRDAHANFVWEKAKRRGSDQAGTLGSGNHFLEIQKVDQIFDEEAGKALGLFQNQAVMMIHTGSRGLGHQNAADYIRRMVEAMRAYNIKIPDRELACVPFFSPEGRKYFGALACGSNFAWANRQMITHFARVAWKRILGDAGGKLRTAYDVAHNTAKIEEHLVDGVKKKLIVHRKGATRAYPAGHTDIPEKYRSYGQPVFIPGSMGTASYVLMGTPRGKETFFTTCHGSGRRLSRHAAIRQLSPKEIVRNLEAKGIRIKCWNLRGVAEEAPAAYKDIEEVIDVVHNTGISRKVARLTPLAVIKGE